MSLYIILNLNYLNLTQLTLTNIIRNKSFVILLFTRNEMVLGKKLKKTKYCTRKDLYRWSWRKSRSLINKLDFLRPAVVCLSLSIS